MTHTAYVDPVKGGLQARCKDCSWKGEVRSTKVTIDKPTGPRAYAYAESLADKDVEAHELDTQTD